ncbi:unnamed protein product [Prunus armeniaca]
MKRLANFSSPPLLDPPNFKNPGLTQGKRTFEISKWARYRLDVENTTGSVTDSEEFGASPFEILVGMHTPEFLRYCVLVSGGVPDCLNFDVW